MSKRLYKYNGDKFGRVCTGIRYACCMDKTSQFSIACYNTTFGIFPFMLCYGFLRARLNLSHLELRWNVKRSLTYWFYALLRVIVPAGTNRNAKTTQNQSSGQYIGRKLPTSWWVPCFESPVCKRNGEYHAWHSLVFGSIGEMGLFFTAWSGLYHVWLVFLRSKPYLFSL